MQELDDPDHLREEYVIPFYLDLMDHNALNAEPELLLAVQERAKDLSTKDVERLLHAPWRPRVMGAWYSIANPQPELVAAVHKSLRSSQGRLTAPPLMTAVLCCAGEDTLAAIADYERSDAENQWGADGAARAAAQVLSRRLGVDSPLPPSSGEDLRAMEGLLGIAQQLQRPR